MNYAVELVTNVPLLAHWSPHTPALSVLYTSRRLGSSLNRLRLFSINIPLCLVPPHA